VRALRSAVEKYKAGDPKARDIISSVLKDATDLYTDHIWREDYLLFPMSEKVLLDQDRESLVKDFDEVEMRFGSSFHEKYERLVDKLERDLASATELRKEGTVDMPVTAPTGEEHSCPLDSRDSS
jgi:hemerythrin-like domain-containing protein